MTARADAAAALDRDFRLPKDVRPSRYDIRFDLDLERWRSEGWERIAVRLERPRREIVLHATDLEIRAARAGKTPASVTYHAEAEAATLRFDEELRAGDHSLELEFSGSIREDLRGLYRSTRPGERYACTQLAAADARRAFPCFDEPEFKARFALTLVAPSGLATIANAPVERVEQLPDGRTRTTFATTPPISSYLLAFAVGPFEATEPARTKSGVPCRVWLPKGLGAQGLFAREAHARSLEFLESYTAIPYPYTKVDGIGLPDFAAGAMENPGAITYRLRLLSMDPAKTSVGVLRAAFETIAHELTHMWWGDLATLAWWDDIWLNEAFATLIGNKTVATLRPEWGIWRDFVADVTGAFALDALVSTHPISGEVRNAQQASERFDAISYEKGAAVLRMIERYLGEDVFRDGVRAYLRRYAEKNATADDFWRELDEASGQDVSRIAHAWIKEPGHPLLSCDARSEDGALRVRISQRRCYADPSAAPSAQRWPVPVVLKFRTGAGVREQRVLVEAAGAEVTLPGATWYFPNAGAAGFYRFALDEASFARLVDAVFELTPEERLLLVDDIWALARAGAVPLARVVGLLRRMQREDDRVVLERVARVLLWLDTHAVRDPTRDAFERFAGELFRAKFDALGWTPRDAEPEDARLVRRTTLDMVGRLARARDIREEALRRIRAYLDGGERLDPDVAAAAASVAATIGDVRLHERYVARMRESQVGDPQEEARFRGALTDFEDPALVRRTLDLCFDPRVIRPQDLPHLLFPLLRSPHARDATWRRVRERWDHHLAKLDPWLRQGIVESLSQLTPRRYVDEVIAFLAAKRTTDTAEVVARATERLRVDAASAERLAAELETALR